MLYKNSRSKNSRIRKASNKKFQSDFVVVLARVQVIYATYIFNVEPLNPTLAFTILSLFNTLRFPLVVLPKALRGTSGGLFWIQG